MAEDSEIIKNNDLKNEGLETVNIPDKDALVAKVAAYIKAFFKNINRETVEGRMK